MVCPFYCFVGLILACVVALVVVPARGQTPEFAAGVSLGTVTAFQITEASGLVASRQNPGVLWTHNDNDQYVGSVFALSTNGALLGQYQVPGVYSGDFEDIAVGPGPDPGRQYIYFGDIGDNNSSRSQVYVYRIPEPAVYAYQANAPRFETLTGVQPIALIYPDGARNAEALLVDPLTSELFIATKEEDGSRLYRASRAQLESGLPVTLAFVRTIDFSGFRDVAGGDISHDGRLIGLRREGRAWRWTRSATQSIGDALGVNGTVIPVIGTPDEPNGEALAFHHTGLGYYTLSEDYGQPIYFFQRTDAGVPHQPRTLVQRGEAWRYQDTGTDEGSAWRGTNFNAAGWAIGAGQLGYGQGDEATVLSYGPDDFIKNTNTYFRKQFTYTPSGTLSNLALRVCFNDGIAVYLNGGEILRRNLASDAGAADYALADNSAWQNVWFSSPVSPSLIRAGTNTLAVEVHRFDPSGPTLSFDLQLLESPLETPPHFTSLPRLIGSTCSIGVAGPVGSLVTIDRAPDFQNWSLAGQLIMSGSGTNLFQEPFSPGTPQRFYRIRP